MAAEPVLLVAAGGLAREALSAIRAGGSLEPVGFLDDDPVRHGIQVSGLPILGGIGLVEDHVDARLVICAGSGIVREELVGRLSTMGVEPDRYATVIAPSASIGDGCSVGPGTILLGQVVVTADAVIGAHVVIMPNATVTHDVVLDDFVTVCAGVSLGGSVRIGRTGYLGMNSAVRQDLSVGVGGVLGMGSVLVADLPPGETWIGVPARRLRQGPASVRDDRCSA